MGRGCGGDRGGLFLLRRDQCLVDKADLAKEISAQLENRSGARLTPSNAQTTSRVKWVRRPADVTRRREYGVDVNVTKVEGTDVKFDLKVDDQPS